MIERVYDLKRVKQEKVQDNKVGILTFTYGDNFGQRLQNLAVQEVINAYGFCAYTIPQQIPKYYKPSSDLRHEYFKEFDDKYINYYHYPIGKYTIPKGLKTFSFFVTGSDQVWSPYSPDVNYSFFLRFTKRKKRIAFSPSMACDDIPLKKQLLYKLYFNGFDKISVREEKTAQIIKKLVSKPVTTLIDPTLMFNAEFWKKYQKAPSYNMPERYILYYGLGKSEELTNIVNIAQKRHCEVLILKKGYKEFDIGPSEFLYLIDHAEFVATDSYHGTIFAILFKKPFLYLERKQEDLNMSSRFDTLFQKLSISDRKIQNIESDQIDDLDFDKIFMALQKERDNVHMYLSEYFE